MPFAGRWLLTNSRTGNRVNENAAKPRLTERKPWIGGWLVLCSPFAAECVAHPDYAWPVMNTEHSPASPGTVAQCVQAISITDTSRMARVAANEPMLIKRLLARTD